MTRAVLCIIAVFLFAVSNALTTLEDLDGEYMGQVTYPTIRVLLEDGSSTSICRNKFSEQCLDELGLPVQRVVIRNNMISFNLVSASSVTSREEAREAYPACAAEDKYPVQHILSSPPAEILSYDNTEGRLTFRDPRRANDTNCAILNLNKGRDGMTLSARYFLDGTTASENEVLTYGVRSRCIIINDRCVSGGTTKGDFITFVDVSFVIPCIAGYCTS